MMRGTRPGTRVSSYAPCLGLSYVALVGSSTLVAFPILAALARIGVGRLPEGDRALFEPGALMLLEIVRLGRPWLARAFEASAILAVASSLTTLPITAAVMVRLMHEKPPQWRVWLGRTLGRVPTFLLLGGVTMLARATVLVVLAVSAARYHDMLRVTSGSRAADLPLLAGTLLATLIVALLGAFQDLTRAVAVARQADGYGALTGGLSIVRHRPLRWLLPWLAAAGGTLAAALVTAWSAAAFDLSRDGAWRASTDFLLTQVAVAMALTTRVWWFDRALQLARAPL
jgi:hypothetical protein